MRIWILGRRFLDDIIEVGEYESVVWSERFRSPGDFELIIPMPEYKRLVEANVDLVSPNTLYRTDKSTRLMSPEKMIISHQDQRVTITGVSFEARLAWLRAPHNYYNRRLQNPRIEAVTRVAGIPFGVSWLYYYSRFSDGGEKLNQLSMADSMGDALNGNNPTQIGTPAYPVPAQSGWAIQYPVRDEHMTFMDVINHLYSTEQFLNVGYALYRSKTSPRKIVFQVLASRRNNKLKSRAAIIEEVVHTDAHQGALMLGHYMQAADPQPFAIDYHWGRIIGEPNVTEGVRSYKSIFMKGPTYESQWEFRAEREDWFNSNIPKRKGERYASVSLDVSDLVYETDYILGDYWLVDDRYSFPRYRIDEVTISNDKNGYWVAPTVAYIED